MATVEILVFEVGENVLGVNIADVVEITTSRKVTPVPSMPEAYEGVCDSRGVVIPVINLYKVLHVSTQPEQTMFVTCSYTHLSVAFVTGKVHGIKRVESKDIINPPALLNKGENATHCKLTGVIASNDCNILLVALDSILKQLGLLDTENAQQAVH